LNLNGNELLMMEMWNLGGKTCRIVNTSHSQIYLVQTSNKFTPQQPQCIHLQWSLQQLQSRPQFQNMI